MPIRVDQLREKEDYQQLIVERLVQDNKYRERPNTAFRAGLAMDTEVLLEFLENTQHKTMEQLRAVLEELAAVQFGDANFAVLQEVDGQEYM